MTLQCCRCKMLKENDTWAHGYLYTDVEISHTYCPVCVDEALQEIREDRILSTQFAMDFA